MITTGKYLREKRLLNNLTLQQVVDSTKKEYSCTTSTSVLSAIETDKNKIIDGELLFVLSDFYGIDLKELQNIILSNLKNK